MGEKNYSRKVANSISAMLAYWDENQICRFANHAYLDWFGKNSEDMIDKMTLQELLGPLYEQNLPFIKEAYKGNIQIFERDIPTPDGNMRSSIATYTPDIVDGEVKGIIVHVADITYVKKIEIELKNAKEKAEELATHDFLTGLPNRVLLEDRVAGSISIAERKGDKFAVCILDMDNFKEINDSFGHLAGDEVLKEMAHRSKPALREHDTMSRIGGDEFVILLLNIGNRKQIETILNRMLSSAKTPVVFQDKAIQLSFSLGIAVYPDDGRIFEELLSNADKALYKSKGLGKNCFSFFEK